MTLPIGGQATDGDIRGQGRRYLRARTEISADKSGDIRPQSCTMDRQDKVYMGFNSANG